MTTAVKKAFETAKPEILNSDQGSQFTEDEYIAFVESNRVKINMDGKGRRADNIPIERWFRTLKYEEIYLKDYDSPQEARSEIGKFICDYNFARMDSFGALHNSDLQLLSGAAVFDAYCYYIRHP